jgi:hypothetical protein
MFGDEFAKSMQDSREQARRCPKGVDPEHLVPGAIVTHGPSKHTGDRSGIEVIYRVLARNGGHVALEVAHPDYFYKLGKRRLVVISEHEWYLAEHMLDALTAPSKQQIDDRTNASGSTPSA